MIKTVNAIRYITPLHEGGSLPAVVEADDGAMYVMKFIGAGQGPKALIAELIAGEIGRALGLRVPELALMTLDSEFGRSEPNAEIQDLLKRSAGQLNLGLRYLPNALEFNMLLKPSPNSKLASAVVWFDAYITNVDRTPRNVNMLVWHNDLWLIDHGAALYFHHSWDDYLSRSLSPFTQIKYHTLLPFAETLPETNERLQPLLSRELIEQIVGQIPEAWLDHDSNFTNYADHRAAYADFLTSRLAASSIFVGEAINARSQLV
jgi:hypothetical protein